MIHGYYCTKSDKTFAESINLRRWVTVVHPTIALFSGCTIAAILPSVDLPPEVRGHGMSHEKLLKFQNNRADACAGDRILAARRLNKSQATQAPISAIFNLVIFLDIIGDF